jgi:integrase/recombinase XerD
MNIKKKRTKRLSPYGEHEIWDIKELQAVIKYEPHKRNKAILSLLWDLNGRNHKITLLRLKHIRLNEQYWEGEIPYQAKTGSQNILKQKDKDEVVLDVSHFVKHIRPEDIY